MRLRHLSPILCLALLLAAAALCVPFAHVASGADIGPNCDATGSIDSEELQFLQLINNYRTQNNLQPLVLSSALDRSAAWKAQNVADWAYFEHDDVPIGRTWTQRLRDCGYTYNAYLGENMAGGDATAAGNLSIWQHSPTHDGVMLSDVFFAIGIARAHNAAGYWYWVTDFGGVVDARIAGGDVDCNNRVDSRDATLILQQAATLVRDLPCEGEADVDSSGAIDATDALFILQHAAGLVD